MPAPKLNTRKVSLPVMRREARFSPKSIDEEKRTVDIVWATKSGSRVLRRRFFSEDFYEELSLKKKHVRMGRLESGTAPFLDQHGFGEGRGVKSVLGVIEGAKIIEDKEGRATVRFSKREDVEPIFQDIKDGILQNVSVGYNVFRFIELEETAPDGLKIFRAIDWEPVEISQVPAGADPDAHVRSKDSGMTECVVERLEKVEPVDGTRDAGDNKNTDAPTNEIVENQSNLSETQDNNRGQNMPAPKTAEEIKAEIEATRLKAQADEKKRAVDIRAIVLKLGKRGLDAKLADEYIDGDKSVEEVRELVIEVLAKEDAKPTNETRSANGNANISMGEDLSRKGRIEGMTSALLHRFRPKAVDTRENGQKVILPGYELVESGREYAYLTLSEMARASLEAIGVRTGEYPKHVLADMALNNSDLRSLNSTSDFPEILANVANKTLRGGYLAAPKTWAPFTREVFEADFKEIARVNLGDTDKLEKLEEGSEIKHGSIGEAAEKYRIEEFARIISLTRKTIINDDLNAFARLPERLGRRAADLESDLVYDVWKANAALSDGFALYSASHGNLSAAPGAPTEAGLTEARKFMRRQVGLNGAEISLTPVWVIVPPEHETATEKLIAASRPNNASDVNPFGPQGRTSLQMDVEPRLETGAGGSLTAWFMTADKGQVDMIELARLQGTDGPQIQTRDGFEVNGTQIKIMHDVGVKAIDHRGLFKNAGA